VTDHQIYAIVLGRLLVKLRGDRSQQEVSKAIGISQSSLSRFENGETLPDVFQLCLLAWHYKIPPGKLIDLAKTSGDRVRQAAKRGKVALEKAAPEIVRALTMLVTAES